MLAAAIDVQIETSGPLGLIIDGSNNSVQDIDHAGAAMKAGIERFDLIIEIDGQQVTEFDGQPGPVDGTVLVTSEPQSTMGAHAALAEGESHTFRLLRRVECRQHAELLKARSLSNLLLIRILVHKVQQFFHFLI